MNRLLVRYVIGSTIDGTRPVSSSPRLTAHLRALLPPAVAALVFGLAVLCASAVHAQPAESGGPRGSIVARDVVVGENDTLRRIARRELGKSGLAHHLGEYNDIIPDMPLVPGTLVRIPMFVPLRVEFASVVFVKGAVTRNDAPLARNAEVHLRDVILTGNDGFVSLEFDSGSVVNIQPNSQVELIRLNCLEQDDSCLIELEASGGQLQSDVQVRDGQPADFRISTPYASAAVRGTVFDVATDDDALVMGVTEGVVGLAASGVGVDVPEGFGSVAREGQPPSPPVALLPAPVYRFIPSRAAPGDHVSWWPMSDADGYQAQLSIDSGGDQVVAQQATDTTRLEIAALEPGDYYIGVRGVDEVGLKGYTATTRLTIAAIDDSLPSVDTRITRDGQEYLVEIVQPVADAPGYEIQLATEPDFEDPLTIDIRDGQAVFRLDAQTVYARARVLLTPQIVSAFGETAEAR